MKAKFRYFFLTIGILCLFTIGAAASDAGYTTLIYSDGTNQTEPVQVGDGTGTTVTVTLPETVTAAGLPAKTGYGLEAWLRGDGTRCEPGSSITLTAGSCETLQAAWYLEPPTVRLIEIGKNVQHDPTTNIYTEIYGNWGTSNSDRFAFQVAVTHPLQQDQAFTCALYFNGEHIHQSVTNWWGNNRSPSYKSDDLAVSLNAVADSGQYWYVARHNGYTSAPSSVYDLEILPADVTLSAKNQSADVTRGIATTPSSSTVLTSANTPNAKVNLSDIAATGAVKLERGESLGGGKYEIRVVISDPNAMPNYVMAAGNTAVLTLTGAPKIQLANHWTPEAAEPDPANVTITGYEDLGTPPSKDTVTYQYFSDAACTRSIAQPTQDGIYYYKAYTPAQSPYLAGESNAAVFRIGRTALTLTPKSHTVPENTPIFDVPVKDLIPQLQSDGYVLGADFADWIDWQPTEADEELTSFFSGGNLRLTLGAADLSNPPYVSYPIVLSYVDPESEAVSDLEEYFAVTFAQGATLTLRPVPTFVWTELVENGVIELPYTGETVDLDPADYFKLTDGKEPAAELKPTRTGFTYHVVVDADGTGVTPAVKAALSSALGIPLGQPISFSPSMPADLVLYDLTVGAGLDPAELAQNGVQLSLRYYAVPYCSGIPDYEDAEGTPAELRILPAVVELRAKDQTMKCTDPLIGQIHDVLQQYGEFPLDSSTFPIAAEMTKGTMTTELSDAIANGYLALTLGDKTPADGVHQYTQPIRIGFSKNVPADILALLPMLYDVTMLEGTLTVQPYTVSLSWSNTGERLCGDGAVVTAQITDGIDPSYPDVAVSVTGGDATQAGSYTASASLIGQDAPHYVIRDGQATAAYTLLATTFPVQYEPGSYGAEATQSDTKYRQQPLTLADALFTRTGYTQTGWAQSDGGESVYAFGAVYETDAPLTLYPVWLANTYTVTFDANGGSGSMEDQSFVYDRPAALAAAAFTKPGQHLTGWRDEQGNFYTPGQTVSNLSAEADGTVILYAQWSDKPAQTVTMDTSDRFAYISDGTLEARIATAAGTVTYTSSDPAIATVDQHGVVTLLATGEVTITAHAAETDDYAAGTASYRLLILEDPACDGIHDCPSTAFSDLETDRWYHEATDFVIDAGLMNGVGSGCFAPDDTTNRAMVVTILWRLEGEPAAAVATNFDDVEPDRWYTDAITWAASEQIVKGYSTDSFGPNDPITREQFVTILWRYAQHKGYHVDARSSINMNTFDDTYQISDYAKEAMQWACSNGLMEGDGESLTPRSNATRAQAAALFQRFCESITN